MVEDCAVDESAKFENEVAGATGQNSRPKAAIEGTVSCDGGIISWEQLKRAIGHT